MLSASRPVVSVVAPLDYVSTALEMTIELILMQTVVQLHQPMVAESDKHDLRRLIVGELVKVAVYGRYI
jgi:hypothetical protein